jgi:hypothetical protein
VLNRAKARAYSNLRFLVLLKIEPQSDCPLSPWPGHLRSSTSGLCPLLETFAGFKSTVSTSRTRRMCAEYCQGSFVAFFESFQRIATLRTTNVVESCCALCRQGDKRDLARRRPARICRATIRLPTDKCKARKRYASSEWPRLLCFSEFPRT